MLAHSQLSAPLFEALLRYLELVKSPLHVPGHKLGCSAPSEWREFLGSKALAIDLTEAPGLDDLHAPDGPIREAQELAAEAFGAYRSFFLVGGSTAGLQALILAASRPGAVIAVPRFAHRSVLGALILSGAWPAWILPRFDTDLGVATGVDLPSYEMTVPRATAVVLVHPTYYGIVDHLKTLIQYAQDHSTAVLVDEAHGSHFAFHEGLPPTALSLGADGVVQSTHKTGGSLTQSGMCHLGHSRRLSEQRVAEMLRLVQSTSPSYILMASLDLARRQLFLHGRTLWERLIDSSNILRTRLSQVKGVRIHPVDDPCKLVVDVRGRGITGFHAAKVLWEYGVAVETSDVHFFLAVLGPGDTEDFFDRFVHAVENLPWGSIRPPSPQAPPMPEVVASPREAFLADKESVPLDAALGRIAGEMIAPYPPGIPVFAPGERVTTDVIAYLEYVANTGHRLQGPVHPGLQKIQVIKE